MTSTGLSGSSSGPVTLTPLNLFLVSITLPDIPFVDPEPEPAANLLGSLLYEYWSLDEGSGSQTRERVSDTLVAFTSFTAQWRSPGKVGGSELYSPDISGSSVRRAWWPEGWGQLPNGQSLAVSFWVKPTGEVTTGEHTAFSTTGSRASTARGYSCRLFGTDRLEFDLEGRVGAFGVGRVELVYNGPTSAGVWGFATYNQTTGTCRLYINGALADEKTFPDGPMDSMANDLSLFMFNANRTNAQRYAGSVDELAFFSGREFTQEDAAWLYNNGNGRSFGDLQ